MRRINFAFAICASPLWIDDVCIEQENLDEQGAQVATMGDIYSNARISNNRDLRDDVKEENVAGKLIAFSNNNCWPSLLELVTALANFP